ncbi:MAG: cupin domain-containing protein [Thermomicrobiales bacterium]
MTRSPLTMLSTFVVLTAGLFLSLGMATGQAAQQTSSVAQPLFAFPLDDAELPAGPAFVRIVRITLAPGARSPLHTHPGPEFGVVESGTVRVHVNGKTLVQTESPPRAAAATPATAVATPAPVTSETDADYVLRAGDQIAYMPGTELTFRNSGSKQAVILAAVVLPAGPDRPNGLDWVGGTPDDAQLAGVEPVVLGDGVADKLPDGRTIVRLEKVALPSGAGLEASDNLVMYSVTGGKLDFSVDSGSVQVSRSTDPGARADADQGTTFALATGDAAFFPDGLAAAPRSDRNGELDVLRFSIAPATATSSAAEPAHITIQEPATPTPEPTEVPTPTPRPQGQITNGSVVVVTQDVVNVRSGPSTDAPIIAEVTKDTELTVTGPSEEGSGYTWWPIQNADGSVAGYVVEDFIAPKG